MFSFDNGETVILHRYTGSTKNSHGSSIATYTDVPLENVAVFSGTNDETGTKVSTGKRLVTTENVEINSKDKVTVRGIKYDVDGDASGNRINPFTGDSFGTRIQLKKVTG